jgi:hypothetical protein
MEEILKNQIRKSEERFIWYKKELGFVFQNKESFPPDDKNTEWYKEILRENKNREEQWLKANQDEILYFRQGLNPPYCYKRKNNGV